MPSHTTTSQSHRCSCNACRKGTRRSRVPVSVSGSSCSASASAPCPRGSLDPCSESSCGADASCSGISLYCNRNNDVNGSSVPHTVLIRGREYSSAARRWCSAAGSERGCAGGCFAPMDVAELRIVCVRTIPDTWTLSPDDSWKVSNTPTTLLFWGDAPCGVELASCDSLNNGGLNAGTVLPTRFVPEGVAVVRLRITNNSDNEYVCRLTPATLLNYLRQQHMQQGDVYFTNPRFVVLPRTSRKRGQCALSVPKTVSAALKQALPEDCPCIFVPPGGASKLGDLYQGDGVQRRGNSAYVNVYYAPWNWVGATTGDDTAGGISYLGNIIPRDQMVHVKVYPGKVDNGGTCVTSSSFSGVCND